MSTYMPVQIKPFSPSAEPIRRTIVTFKWLKMELIGNRQGAAARRRTPRLPSGVYCFPSGCGVDSPPSGSAEAGVPQGWRVLRRPRRWTTSCQRRWRRSQTAPNALWWAWGGGGGGGDRGDASSEWRRTTAETDAVCSFTRSRFYQSFGVIASLLEGEGLVASKLSSSLF